MFWQSLGMMILTVREVGISYQLVQQIGQMPEQLTKIIIVKIIYIKILSAATSQLTAQYTPISCAFAYSIIVNLSTNTLQLTKIYKVTDQAVTNIIRM